MKVMINQSIALNVVCIESWNPLIYIDPLIYIFDKTWVLWITISRCGSKDKQIFKEEESSEILSILGLINNVEEYIRVYTYFKDKYGWRKQVKNLNRKI